MTAEHTPECVERARRGIGGCWCDLVRRASEPYRTPGPHGFGPFSLRETYLREGRPECPGCGRIMSSREAAEQGACNDCHPGGAYLPE